MKLLHRLSLRRAGLAAAFFCVAAGLAGAGTSWGATLSLPHTGAGPGAALAIPIDVDDADGFFGTDLFILFDASVVAAGSVSTTVISSDQTLGANVGPGTVRISLYGTTALSGSGALLDINFTSAGPPGSYTLLSFIWADVNEGEIPVIVEDGSWCVQGTVPPPGPVTMTRAPGSPVAGLSWDANPWADSYNVYRGSLRTLADLACFQSGVFGNSTVDDGAVPVVGSAFFYLVTSVTCAGESSAGQGSSGAPRVLAGPCP
jgi:hypothetical protein